MTPSLILHLWRERWGKAEQSIPNKPYLTDAVYQWGTKFAASQFLSTWGLPLLSLSLFVAFAFFVANLRFSLNGQISFAGLMIASAFLFRRYAGAFFTLSLLSITTLCVMQYFTWRFSQSLQNQFGSIFVWAFIVAASELIVVFCLAVTWLEKIWPISDAAIAMPTNQQDWPVIQIALIATSSPSLNPEIESDINAIRTQLSQIAWPEKRLQVTVLKLSDTDAQLRQRELDQFLAQSNAELAIFVETHAIKKTNVSEWLFQNQFLERLCAWFVRDHGLSFLYGKNSFLSDHFGRTEERVTKTLNSRSAPISVLRVSAWNAMSELSVSAKLRELMRKSSYLIALPQKSENSNDPALLKFSKIDRADSRFIQNLKRRTINTREMLSFYKPLMSLIFLTTPLALLVFGQQLITAKFEWFGALAFPALCLLGITHSRLNIFSRWSSWRQFLETLLALYFVLLVPFTFLRTVIKKPRLLIARWWSQMTFFELLSDVVIGFLFFANFAGFLFGLDFLLSHDLAGHQWRVLFTLWAGFNCLLLLARQAIEHEKSHIIWFAKQQMIQTGSIRLRYGRSIVCNTTNFPNSLLQLQLPIDPRSSYQLGIGDSIELNFSKNNQHYGWSAIVTQIEGQKIVATVPNGATGHEAFEQTIFARTADWPKWFPSKTADRPFPQWFYSFIDAAPAKMIEWGARLLGFFTWKSISRLWAVKSKKS